MPCCGIEGGSPALGRIEGGSPTLGRIEGGSPTLARVQALLVALAWLSAACGGDDDASPAKTGATTTSAPCPSGALLLADGRCLPAGEQENGCHAGELSQGGACVAAGVAAEVCPDGFVSDGHAGCAAVLPDAACPKGQMAVPGETACRDVAPCAAGTWGDIPVEADTQFVDGAYAGTDSDGSSAKPWTTVKAAIAAAADGAIVAIAEGSYGEDIVVTNKRVRLWGRCPSLVELVGQGDTGAVFFRYGADGSEVRDLAIRGPQIGLVSSGSTDVALRRVWIHDVGWRCVDVESGLGRTSMSIEGALLEGCVELGVLVQAASLAMDASLVRDGKPRFGQGGAAVSVQNDDEGVRADLTVGGSLLERNRYAGIVVHGADAVVQATLVRDTSALEDGNGGSGILVDQDPLTAQSSGAKVSGVAVERATTAGIYVAGSTAELDAVTVRDTAPNDVLGGGGVGLLIDVGAATQAPAVVTMRSSLVDRSTSVGINVRGSSLTLEGVRVRGTLPTPQGREGGGIQIAPLSEKVQRASFVSTGSVVEQVALYGIAVFGSDATLEGLSIHDVAAQASDGSFGHGLSIVDDVETGARSVVSLRSSVVEACHDVGAYVIGSDADLAASVIRGTQPVHDEFGDGLCSFYGSGPAIVRAEGMLIADNARSGATAYGASLALGSSKIACNLVDLDGETYHDIGHTFADLGNNACGCAEATACQVSSSSLAPPAVPVGP